MLNWHSCQICYPLEIKILLLLQYAKKLSSIFQFGKSYLSKTVCSKSNIYLALRMCKK